MGYASAEPLNLRRLTNRGIVENPQQQLFEVNPARGEVIDALNVKGPRPSEVTCASGRKLSAVGYASAKDKAKGVSASAGWQLATQDR